MTHIPQDLRLKVKHFGEQRAEPEKSSKAPTVTTNFVGSHGMNLLLTSRESSSMRAVEKQQRKHRTLAMSQNVESLPTWYNYTSGHVDERDDAHEESKTKKMRIDFDNESEENGTRNGFESSKQQILQSIELSKASRTPILGDQGKRSKDTVKILNEIRCELKRGKEVLRTLVNSEVQKLNAEWKRNVGERPATKILRIYDSKS